MEVVLNIGGLLEYLLLGDLPDDQAVVIGHSRVAYLSKRDPGHVFLGPAMWHDACYGEGSGAQDAWSRAQVDRMFLEKMLIIADGDYRLEKEAVVLYLLVRKHAAPLWEGRE